MKQKKIIAGLIGLLLTAIRMVTVSIDSADEISYEDMEEVTEYYFDELILVDAHTEEKSATYGVVTGYEYLVCFKDGDGTLVYASFQPPVGSEMEEACEEYLENEDEDVGDVVFSGCFSGASLGESDVSGYLEEIYSLWNQEQPGRLLNWRFTYDGMKTKTDYVSEERSDDVVGLVFVSVLVVSCLIGILILSKKRKELNQYLADYSQAGAVPEVGTWNFSTK